MSWESSKSDQLDGENVDNVVIRFWVLRPATLAGNSVNVHANIAGRLTYALG